MKEVVTDAAANLIPMSAEEGATLSSSKPDFQQNYNETVIDMEAAEDRSDKALDFYLLSKPTPAGVEALPLLVLVHFNTCYILIHVTDTVVGALGLVVNNFSNVYFRCNILLTIHIH